MDGRGCTSVGGRDHRRRTRSLVPAHPTTGRDACERSQATNRAEVVAAVRATAVEAERRARRGRVG